MYDYRCKECENFGQCMSMMNMPMMNMPMANMFMMDMPMYENQMPMYTEDDEDLKSMYPEIYIGMYPMVKHHYDMIVAKHGRMYCPSKDEMDHMCKDICDKYKEHNKDRDEDNDDDDDCNDNGMREQESRFDGGGGLGDLVRILLIGNLIEGRNF
ncbi:MAG TPA: hypothetical protein VIM42_06775 [Clostridium sp.]